MRTNAPYLFAILLLACNGNDEGADAGAPDASFQVPDGGITTDAGHEKPDAGDQCTGSCASDSTNLEDCKCISNSDCAPAFFCQEFEDQIFGLCTCGERGTGVFGSACSEGRACASGLCINEKCTRECDGHEDCEEPLASCNTFLGACVPVN